MEGEAQKKKSVLEVNTHFHTKSCRKYDCPCRFFYPRIPSIRTIIAEPISGTDGEDKPERLKNYEETLRKVKDIFNDADTIEEIIADNLGLSCAKLRFSCASQLSLYGKTLEII